MKVWSFGPNTGWWHPSEERCKPPARMPPLILLLYGLRGGKHDSALLHGDVQAEAADPLTALWFPALSQLAGGNQQGKLSQNPVKIQPDSVALQCFMSVYWALAYCSWNILHSADAHNSFWRRATVVYLRSIVCVKWSSIMGRDRWPLSVSLPPYILYHNNGSPVGPETDRKLGHPSASALPLRGTSLPLDTAAITGLKEPGPLDWRLSK